MNEPTPIQQKQIKKFWAWCGVKPEKQFENLDWFWRYPPVDLNNLFKYAVPKLQDYTLAKSLNGGHNAAVHIAGRWSGIENNDNPALALFWVIYKAAGLEE